MREIKFRGKCATNFEWKYGDLLHDGRVCFIYRQWRMTFPIKVYPDTVGQYTGLNDINGIPIYEGDIVERPPMKKLGVVRYSDTEARFGVVLFADIDQPNYAGSLLHEIGQEMVYRVVGNIYDNPELIKQ